MHGRWLIIVCKCPPSRGLLFFDEVYNVYTLSYNYAMSNTQEQVVMSIRIDKETKDKAAEVFEAMGMDLSGGIKLFLNNVITEGSLGFTPMTKDGLKFKYFREYKRQLDRERRVWKKLYGVQPKE